MKIGVLLSGCGVYDGAEIQESVLTLLAIGEVGAEYQCISVDADQHHVVNHLTGEETGETRNMLVESARIARGNVMNINAVTPADIDALVIPGGFGSAKNFTKWAFEGPNGDVLPEVKLLLVNMINVGKPVAALCVSPVVLAKALEGADLKTTMTIGSDAASSPYDITAFSAGLETAGVRSVMKTAAEIHVDEENKIVTAPCYMMDTDILGIRENISAAVKALTELVK
jgi:enhancing lycopene biosynthesis protein 2